MRKLVPAVALLTSLALACGRPDKPPGENLTLVPGAVHPRTFTGEGPYRFRFAAAADLFLCLSIEQRGVDVVVFLRDPQGRLLFEVDSPTGKKERETVLAVTPVAGEYVLAVESLTPEATGAFALEVREVRPANARDRKRAAAASAFARGERRRMSRDFEEATMAYRAALPDFQASGEWEGLARAEWRLGESLLEMGQLRQAAVVLERAATRFHGLSDSLSEARALASLGITWRRLGAPGRSLAFHRRALRLHRTVGNQAGEAAALNDMGLVSEMTGNLQDAIGHYEAALVIWRRLEIRTSEAATLENLGSLYALLGHDAEALDLLQRSVKLAGTSNEKRRASALIELGWAHSLAGRPEVALECYREAITLARSAGDRAAEMGAWDRRGSALRALRRTREAAASYERALAMSRAAGRRLDEGHTLANIGWLDLETGGAPRARERLQRAVELLVAGGDPNGEVYARIGLSRAERRLGGFAAARRNAEVAIRLVEELRTGLRGSVSRSHFLATRYDAYEELVALLSELDRSEPAAGHAREALEVAERARARNLLDQMSADRNTAGARPEEADRRRSLQAEIQAMDERRQALVALNPRDPRLGGLDATLRQRWLELDRLAAPAVPQPGLAPATAAEIQALADNETLFLVYLLAEPESFAWTVDRQRVIPHRLPGRERIEKLTRRLVLALPRSHETAVQGTAERAARDLSDAILAPLAGRLAGRRRLVILADAALHLVPFTILPEPVSGREGLSQPLLVRHEIVMLPSATVLRSQRQRLAGRPAAPGAVAVLADAVFSPDDERLSGKISAEDRSRAGNGFVPGPFQRLPYTAREAEAILRLVPRGDGFLAEGFEARRDLVTGGALRRYRILHFATHGLLHPVLPERSGLVLSQVDERGRPRDGFLSAPDVAELDLPAELVVLSACQTGLGREIRGEGLVGLTQAFFRAGARRVVVSYWNIQDQATSEVMARFYRSHLAQGLPPAAALRAAQLSIRQEEKWRSPSYWAGFSLHGDWR